MRARFRLKLFVTMITFALIISFSIAIIDYIKLREEAIANNQVQIQQTENIVVDSLSTIDKAYTIFDQDTTEEMKERTEELMERYNSDPSFENWNFANIKEEIGMDVYIINDQNVIIHTSFTEDQGLDFAECCSDFSSLLDERRQAGEFTVDGLDVQQKTGEIKKFSYMPTPDKKYIIELGYSLADKRIFNEFNFLNVIKELENKYELINEINILNVDGFKLGEPTEENYLTDERQDAFNRSIRSKSSAEAEEVDGNPALYRYLYYSADNTQGISTNRVVEISYNHDGLGAILDRTRTIFLWQLAIVFVVTIILAILISKWVARPMYMAFHDQLTGLKNRTAFEEIMERKIKDQQETALIMIDLDHFKKVNDVLGHDKGDELLIELAACIERNCRKGDTAVRMGGDEFIIVLPNTNVEEASNVAEKLLRSITNLFQSVKSESGISLTASMGISMTPHDGIDIETLYKKADIALYASKEKGKNQYCVYNANRTYAK
ncbi:GGDEF domain-containing protein [Oceanobacillus manasiensis]|uniref:GGDEF domain-containing protein n=1 Tax=Oceanobacillus manasiensis TaxID=586413 RepID=UPI0005A7242E|nr:GGDEF domain-containing protein [Oceanobacillus manasiensis]